MKLKFFLLIEGFRALKFDKTAVLFIYYMVHVMTQNMESRNHMVQGSWASGGSLRIWSPALAGHKPEPECAASGAARRPSALQSVACSEFSASGCSTAAWERPQGDPPEQRSSRCAKTREGGRERGREGESESPFQSTQGINFFERILE